MSTMATVNASGGQPCPINWTYCWSRQQLDVLESVPRIVHLTCGVTLIFISLFGIVTNTVILGVFSRFKRLRTPANVFIINLTLADLCACLLHPMAAYSSLSEGRWAFSQTGCNVYGMGVGLFGLITIVTLAVIACERYAVITAQPMSLSRRMTRRQAQWVCLGIWTYCAALATPPLLFGWSRYEPEGFLVTCSWDYTTKTLANRLYYVYLLTFGFLVPVAVLTYCYSNIFQFVLRHGREMDSLRMSNAMSDQRTDVKTAKIILMLSFMFVVAWAPYAVVSLIGQFGVQPLSPWATTVPALFAKTAVFFNPLVYGFSHPQFRSTFRRTLTTTAHATQNGNPETSLLTVRPAGRTLATRNSSTRNTIHARPSINNETTSSSRTTTTTTTTRFFASQAICIKHGRQPTGRDAHRRRCRGNDPTAVESVARRFQQETERHLFRPTNSKCRRKQLAATGRRYYASEPNLLVGRTDRPTPDVSGRNRRKRAARSAQDLTMTQTEQSES